MRSRRGHDARAAAVRVGRDRLAVADDNDGEHDHEPDRDRRVNTSAPSPGDDGTACRALSAASKVSRGLDRLRATRRDSETDADRGLYVRPALSIITNRTTKTTARTSPAANAIVPNLDPGCNTLVRLTQTQLRSGSRDPASSGQPDPADRGKTPTVQVF